MLARKCLIIFLLPVVSSLHGNVDLQSVTSILKYFCCKEQLLFCIIMLWTGVNFSEPFGTVVHELLVKPCEYVMLGNYISKDLGS